MYLYCYGTTCFKNFNVSLFFLLKRACSVGHVSTDLALKIFEIKIKRLIYYSFSKSAGFIWLYHYKHVVLQT